MFPPLLINIYSQSLDSHSIWPQPPPRVDQPLNCWELSSTLFLGSWFGIIGRQPLALSVDVDPCVALPFLRLSSRLWLTPLPQSRHSRLSSAAFLVSAWKRPKLHPETNQLSYFPDRVLTCHPLPQRRRFRVIGCTGPLSRTQLGFDFIHLARSPIPIPHPSHCLVTRAQPLSSTEPSFLLFHSSTMPFPAA